MIISVVKLWNKICPESYCSRDFTLGWGINRGVFFFQIGHDQKVFHLITHEQMWTLKNLQTPLPAFRLHYQILYSPDLLYILWEMHTYQKILKYTPCTPFRPKSLCFATYCHHIFYFLCLFLLFIYLFFTSGCSIKGTLNPSTYHSHVCGIRFRLVGRHFDHGRGDIQIFYFLQFS